MENEDLQNLRHIMTEKTRNKFVKDSPVQSIAFKNYETPTFKESYYKNYIKAGFDNLWPNYLLKLTTNCAIHNAIVDSKARQIAGEGFTIEDTNDKEQLGLLTQFLKKINSKKTLKRIATDQQTFGFFFIGVTWNSSRTQIANLYHVDASTIRIGLPNKETGKVEHFLYSEDWSQQNVKEFSPEKIDKFDKDNRIAENCLYMCRGYRPATRFYNLPPYEGCRTEIELLGELGEYMLNSIKNGLSPSLLFSFNNGQPTDEEQALIYRSINSLYSGSRNAGKFILAFNKSEQNKTTVEPINTGNLSAMYASLADFAQSQVIIGHKTHPQLVGVELPGSLGNSAGEVERISEQFYEYVISPAQQEIIDCFKELLEVNNFNLDIWIKNIQPISYAYDDSTLMSIMTVDEMRARINLPPLSAADKANLGINLNQLTPAPANVAEIKNSEQQKKDIKMGIEKHLKPYLSQINNQLNKEEE